ncbi:Imm47 family immunity protein [Paenibacillus thiaminolyticus]|uniref:Imm47 family immunity protein n=1 Tax=Paenibacillus thiaminolyticus TaxID=49283 RepID=UPI0025433653|nr:Imm47 family immunity protein [Paenibacillus thiaminolyticus]WII35822.1 Imm47 family immunity protein [Paenibacillus thiaminolyticus]
MANYTNLMNSSWYGEISNSNISDIKESILRSKTEQDIILQLVELFKLGDFTQKTLLIHLLNHSEDEAVLNLCIRIFCSICTHEDLRDSNNLRFLEKATEDAVNTFASAAVTTLSLEVVPYLLTLLEDWDEINDTSTIIRDSIDAFIDFEEHLGADSSVEEIGQYYLEYINGHDPEKYYYNQKLSFPGELAKKLIERVMIAANNGHALEMELIPSLLSIWSGEKVPGDYYTVINPDNYNGFINYVEGLSKKNWEKGQKYFYGHKV